MAEPRPARPTLRHLADQLNLSPTTVSRALNGYPEVGRATRERVESAAQQMGYFPDRSAQRLAHGRADAYGLVVPSGDRQLIDPIFAEFMGGVLDYGAKAGIEVTLVPVPPAGELDAYRRAATERSVDGFIISGPRRGGDMRLDALQAAGVPFVVHGRTGSEAAFAWLDIDNRGAFQQAGQRLIDYGHRRIALLGGDLAQTFGQERYGGLLDALAANNLPRSCLMVCSGPMTEDMGYSFARQLLATDATESPTAIVCSSIYIALGVLRAVRAQGLRVPQDVSLITHDDRASYLRAEYFEPPLTATQSSLRAAGREVAAMLRQRVAGTPPDQLQQEWPVALVPRDSVAAPKS